MLGQDKEIITPELLNEFQEMCKYDDRTPTYKMRELMINYIMDVKERRIKESRKYHYVRNNTPIADWRPGSIKGVPQIPAESRRQQAPAQEKLPKPTAADDNIVVDQMGNPIFVDGKYKKNNRIQALEAFIKNRKGSKPEQIEQAMKELAELKKKER